MTHDLAHRSAAPERASAPGSTAGAPERRAEQRHSGGAELTPTRAPRARLQRLGWPRALRPALMLALLTGASALAGPAPATRATAQPPATAARPMPAEAEPPKPLAVLQLSGARQSALSGTALRLHLLDVEDSRCPQDPLVSCPWAGFVKVRAIVHRADGAVAGLGWGAPPYVSDAFGYRFELRSIYPGPRAFVNPRLEEYTVEVAVFPATRPRSPAGRRTDASAGPPAKGGNQNAGG
ncbi:hypothetical protein IP84_03655 [beta proteobacterium AAP99]|nr:hypothetical protein IP84_03655 [beta proteobacterium AAP99]